MVPPPAQPGQPADAVPLGQPASPAPAPEPVTPFVYEVVEPTTPSTTAIDYLLGAFAVVGTVAAVAIVLGLIFAGTLIAVRRARGTALTGAGSASTRLDLGARLGPTSAQADTSDSAPGGTAGGPESAP